MAAIHSSLVAGLRFEGSLVMWSVCCSLVELLASTDHHAIDLKLELHLYRPQCISIMNESNRFAAAFAYSVFSVLLLL